MSLPRQSPPVTRPDVIDPSSTVDVNRGNLAYLIRVRMELTHGANYNDPAHFAMQSHHRRAECR